MGFYGTLLAGADPSGGFGSTLRFPHRATSRQNEKLNIAAVVGWFGIVSRDVLKRRIPSVAPEVIDLVVSWHRGNLILRRPRVPFLR
jgi:hypothetical protein